MERRAHGIILRTRPLTESSSIVNWITESEGRISTVAKGARRIKSPLRGKLDLFYEAEFSYRSSRRGDLHQLHEVQLLRAYSGIRKDLEALNQAAYCAHFIEAFTETDTPVDELFSLFKALLNRLNLGGSSLAALAFEAQSLTTLGLDPMAASETPEDLRAGLEALSKLDIEKGPLPTWEKEYARRISSVVGRSILAHAGTIPKGREHATPH